jgi:hypothetical protein
MSGVGSSLATGSANASVSSLWSTQSSAGAERLWRAVLEEQVHDLFDLQIVRQDVSGPVVVKSRACELAEDWVGTFASRNFCEVCDLAGLESEAVHSKLKRLLALPAHIRADYKYQSITERAGQLWADIRAFERGELNATPVTQEAA